jgi:hypothetical protein
MQNRGGGGGSVVWEKGGGVEVGESGLCLLAPLETAG